MASRQPGEIRRAYNIMGSIALTPAMQASQTEEGLHGSVWFWIDELTRLYEMYGQDHHSGHGENPHAQIRRLPTRSSRRCGGRCRHHTAWARSSAPLHRSSGHLSRQCGLLAPAGPSQT